MEDEEQGTGEFDDTSDLPVSGQADDVGRLHDVGHCMARAEASSHSAGAQHGEQVAPSTAGSSAGREDAGEAQLCCRYWVHPHPKSR
jgi:hypothetical protein